MFVMKKLLTIFLLISLLLIAGCKAKPKEQAQQPAEKTTPAQTTPKETDEAASAESPALVVAALRTQMKLEGKRFAVAYLGYMSADDGSVPWFLERAGLNDIPFLQNIPDTNVYCGIPQGEVYCIIPVDPRATLKLYARNPASEDFPYYDQLVYEGTGTEPYLLVCNELNDPDILVTMDFSDGITYSWFPQLDEYMFVMGYWGGEYSLSQDGYDSLDISPYGRMLMDEYTAMRDTHNNRWSVPTAQDLIGGTWYSEEYDYDGNRQFRKLVIHEDTLDVTWNLGYDYEDNHYPGAKWTLKNENGVAVLTVNFGEFAGVKSYNLLLDKATGMLYTCVDVTNGEISNEWEAQYRYLNPLSVG